MRLLTATLVFAIGCAGPLANPSAGEWVEVRSKHFTLRSESDQETAVRTVEELERYYAAFDRVAYPHTPKPNFTIDVVLFDGPAAIDELGYDTDALMLQRTGADLEDRFTFLTHGELDATSGPLDYARFLHELAHRFTAFHFPSAPVWLNEGMSELFSTIEIEDDSVLLGKYLPGRVFINHPWSFAGDREVRVGVPISEVPSIAELQAFSQSRFYGAHISDDPDDLRRQQEKVLNYSAAWNLLHLLLLGDRDVRERFTVFLEALARGSNTANDSWSRNFGDIEAKLERDYQSLLHQSTRNIARIPFKLGPQASVATASLSPAQVRLLWASIREGDDEAQWRAELDDIQAAIRLDPKLVAARVALVIALLEMDELSSAARELVTARRLAPKDRSVLRTELLLAMRREDIATMDRVGPALAQQVQTAGEHALVSDYLLQRGKTVAAIRAARAGLDVDPGSWRCFAAIGRAHERTGDIATASDYLGMAINMLGEEDSRRPRLMKRLSALEAKRSK